MCDYSLEHVASRPARVGDKLVSTRFPYSGTSGFAAIEEQSVAVCLRPGTELAFADELQCEGAFRFRYQRLPYKVARFQEINKNQPNVHHDALELPDGQIVLVTKLRQGQHATVLQLPAENSEAHKRRATKSRHNLSFPPRLLSVTHGDPCSVISTNPLANGGCDTVH